ncbi:MAG: hypothetical protein QOF21_2791, partial [Actinomycetota bacterium]
MNNGSRAQIGPAIELRNVSRAYIGEAGVVTTSALDGVDVSIDRG